MLSNTAAGKLVTPPMMRTDGFITAAGKLATPQHLERTLIGAEMGKPAQTGSDPAQEQPYILKPIVTKVVAWPWMYGVWRRSAMFAFSKHGISMDRSRSSISHVVIVCDCIDYIAARYQARRHF